MSIAKPFVKWAGGKKQLIDQIDQLLPAELAEWQNVTYIEPFVGGGAMLFHMLQKYPNIKRAVINDINSDLIECYRTIKKKPQKLIDRLEILQEEYYALPNEDARSNYFYNKRLIYNEETLNKIDRSALFIFLNRTCFNGLHRVNRFGAFNVPFGRSTHPTICDKETILSDHELLQNVEILKGDFKKTLRYANGQVFFYFDPPYRPINQTSFIDYTKQSFNDKSQVRLKKFCDKIHQDGFYFMLSNSDSRLDPDPTSFFDELYQDYNIERVFASRMINADATNRGNITEIIVRNFG